MPNKTIYIRDADLPIWERAQKELGESISAAFVDYLKERLQAHGQKGKDRINEAMNKLLDEINTDLNLNIELHPFWRYPILDQNTVNHGYKLHQKHANPDRIMSVVIWPLDLDKDGRLNPKTGSVIRSEIKRFWNGKTTETHRFLDTTKPLPLTSAQVDELYGSVRRVLHEYPAAKIRVLAGAAGWDLGQIPDGLDESGLGTRRPAIESAIDGQWHNFDTDQKRVRVGYLAQEIHEFLQGRGKAEQLQNAIRKHGFAFENGVFLPID